jgi:site-specific recombinase XerD
VLDENGAVQKKANRSQHGIRKGVAQLLAEGGASKYEITAALAHSEAKTTERYTEIALTQQPLT